MWFERSRKKYGNCCGKRYFRSNLTESDRHKLKGSTVNGKVVSEKKEIQCSNCTGYRLCDIRYDLDKIIYLDCDESNNIQEFTIKQANFEELLEQNEEYKLSEEELATIDGNDHHDWFEELRKIIFFGE